jgi:MFS family permease
MFQNRSLIIIGVSESVSNTGNWITMMAVLAMIVFRGEGNVTQSSGIFLAGLLPTLIFSPVAGWLCDRFDRRALMIFSELASGAIIAGLIFTQNLILIYTLLALQAISISIMTPARQAVVPDVVSRDQLTQANAFLQQLAGIIKIFAPMLAGGILVILNPHQAIILDVISFALSALILSRLPSLPPHPERQSEPGSAQTLPVTGAQGMGFLSILKGFPALRLLFLSIFMGITIIVGFDILSPVYIRDVLKANESLFGIGVGLVGAGSLIVAVWLMLGRSKRNPWHDLLGGILLLALIPFTMALATLTPNLTAARLLIMAGLLLGGLGNGLVNIQAGTLMQLLSPASLLGRIGGVFQTTAVAGQLIGTLATPLLVPSLLSMGMFFALATAILLVQVLVLARQSHTVTASLQAQKAV